VAHRRPAGLRASCALTVTELLQRTKVPGVSVAVIKDSAVHFAEGYGLADADAKRLVRADTLFQAASISKPVTAMATVRLAQEGRLSLDADVNTLLKSWKVPASEHNRDRPVTPRALSSHTSGADDGFGFPGYDPSAPRPSVVQILNGQAPSNVGPVIFARPPFQAYKYSGGSVTLMQLALTEVTGKPFAQLLRETVLGRCRHEQHVQQPLPGRVGLARRTRTTARGWRSRRPGMSIPSRPRPGCGRRPRTWRSSRSRCNARFAARAAPCSRRPRRAR
jgi:hypothetical protein